MTLKNLINLAFPLILTLFLVMFPIREGNADEKQIDRFSGGTSPLFSFGRKRGRKGKDKSYNFFIFLCGSFIRFG